MKTTKSRVLTLFGIALLAAAMTFLFTACPPEPEDPKFPAKKGELTINGLGSFNDNYVFIQGSAGGKPLYGITNFSDSTFHLVKISDGKAVVPIYYINTSGDYIAYDGTDTISILNICIVNSSSLNQTNAASAMTNNLGKKTLTTGSFSSGNYTFNWTAGDNNGNSEDGDKDSDGNYTYLNFKYQGKDNNSTIIILGYTGSGGSVTIPSTINEKPVTTISVGVFSGKQLTSVTIPNSVTNIWYNAFANNQLTNVTIPNSVIYLGGFANNQLTSVTIPNSVTEIDNEAFYNNKLTSVTIPNSVTNIWYNAFANNQLTSVTIPNSVTNIWYNAFANNQLTSVTIPNSVIYLGGFANNQLTSVTIPNSVTEIDNAAFYNNKLTSVTIPDSVTSIGDSAFANNQLTSVTIPNSVTSIGEYAFAWNQLTSVTLPNSVTTIERYAFTSNQLTSVTIGANVELTSSYGYISFPGNFDTVYNDEGKLAGTYTRTDTDSTEWTRQ